MPADLVAASDSEAGSPKTSKFEAERDYESDFAGFGMAVKAAEVTDYRKSVIDSGSVGLNNECEEEF